MATNAIIQPGEPGYDELRSGFNVAVEHRPELIVDAAGADDVVGAVSLAGRQDRPLAVMNTGHGPSVAANGAVLIRTGRMRGVEVDPAARTARIEAGASWREVIDAAAPYGLAPLNGSSPHVGAIGYTLGGGVGLLARRYGFAADHVRSMEVVTADGRLRHVTADSDTNLFWALRGAGANFGVVTAMEVDLFPVTTLFGGELCFPPEACDEALHAYSEWAPTMPETMASSILLLRYPDDVAVPEPLRGQHVTHVRVAYCGDDHVEGGRLVEPLRRLGPRLGDSVRTMPYSAVGTIHHEPTDEPVPAFDRNVLLADFDHDAARVVSKFAGPTADALFLVELRAWGGALSRPPRVLNAVGSRDTAYSLLAIADPTADSRAARDALLDAMEPWATGMTYPNFCGVEDTSIDAVRRSYRPHDFARLQDVKATYDPDNVFRVNFNIPPKRTRRRRLDRPLSRPHEPGGPAMNIGIGLPAAVPDVDATTIGSYAAEAERSGFASVGVIDRLVYDNLEPLTALAAAAATTAHVELFTTVLNVGWRANPVLLGKQIASVDLLSGGRLTVGLGLGGWPEDYAASEVPTTARGARLDAAVDTMRRVWAGEISGQGGPTRRLPDGRPSVLFGGLVPAAFARAATRGEGWVSPLFGLDMLETGANTVRRTWAERGRPGEPRIVTGRYFSLGPDADTVADRYIRHYYGDEGAHLALADTLTNADQVRTEVDRLARAGVTDVILYPCSPGTDQVRKLAGAIGLRSRQVA
jgi:alkanesulfonate monooxygenase SsuD/methylene tetrahydromethanopterin reductase-like flavin-dependent oxidoreductase (luciferase family)/FAD/FMN-containing dehydrogenase